MKKKIVIKWKNGQCDTAESFNYSMGSLNHLKKHGILKAEIRDIGGGKAN